MEYELTAAEQDFYTARVKENCYMLPAMVLSMPHLSGPDGNSRDPEKEPEYFARCRSIRKYCYEVINKYLQSVEYVSMPPIIEE